MSLCGMYCGEIKSACHCRGQFDPVDVNGETVDLAASFCPTSTVALVWKAAMGPFSVFFFVYVWATSEYPGWFLAALTQWGLTISTFYMIASFVCTFSAKLFSYAPATPDARVLASWILFSMAPTMEVIIVILYWLLVYDPEDAGITFKNVGVHGFICLIVIVDGLIINRVPLRMQQWFSCAMPICSLYIVWSAIHSATDIGNPNDKGDSGDPDTNNDLIYQVLDWKGDTWGTLILCVIVVYVVSPIVFSVLWYLSQACGRRRYQDSDDHPEEYRASSKDDFNFGVTARDDDDPLRV